MLSYSTVHSTYSVSGKLYKVSTVYSTYSVSGKLYKVSTVYSTQCEWHLQYSIKTILVECIAVTLKQHPSGYLLFGGVEGHSPIDTRSLC